MFDENGDCFSDRFRAGSELAAKVGGYRRSDAAMLGLARGGVPLAYMVALALDLPLDVLVVRKLGFPGQPELAMGALASGGALVLNDDALRARRIGKSTLSRQAARESAELVRRERVYRGARPPLPLAGRTAILVDDGLATGSSMLAAIRSVSDRGAQSMVVAMPVAPHETCEALADEADEVICLRTPRRFVSVDTWYEDFREIDDAEVRHLLERSRLRARRS